MRTRFQSLFAVIVLALPVRALAQEPEAGKVALRGDQVEHAIAPRLKKIKKCYKAALSKSPKVFGVIGVGMNVSAEGKVSDRWITISTLGDPELEKCTLQAFDGLVFPAPGGYGAVARYGMLLSTPDSPPLTVKVMEESYQRSIADQPR